MNIIYDRINIKSLFGDWIDDNWPGEGLERLERLDRPMTWIQLHLSPRVSKRGFESTVILFKEGRETGFVEYETRNEQ